MDYDNGNGPKNEQNRNPGLDQSGFDLSNISVRSGDALVTNELIASEVDGPMVKRGLISIGNSLEEASGGALKLHVPYNPGQDVDAASTPVRRGGITAIASVPGQEIALVA